MLITHVCIDGKTRLILYAACRDNNKAEVLFLFQNAVQKWGLLSTNLNCILFQGLSGSISKGNNPPKGPTSKGLHHIP